MTRNQLGPLRANTTFVHFFRDMIFSGRWAKMSTSAKALYMVIKIFTDPLTGEARSSYPLLMKYSGLSRPSVASALKELSQACDISCVGTSGKISRYKCREHFDIKNEPGEIVAKSDFVYISSLASMAQNELQQCIKSQLQNINVEHVTINIISGNIINGNIQLSTGYPFYNPQE